MDQGRTSTALNEEAKKKEGRFPTHDNNNGLTDNERAETVAKHIIIIPYHYFLCCSLDREPIVSLLV
jgi:hypothetical protein